MKNFLLPILLLVCYYSHTQNISVPEKNKLRGFFHVDYLSVDMPINDLGIDERHMGLSGIHYNVMLENFYGGLGIYGAVRGERGGFFTLGLDLGYRSNLYKNFFIDTGVHFGGGGGDGAPDGGGAFILPHANIGYQFRQFSLSTGYSYINFFDAGKIKSHQLNLKLAVPIDIDYADFRHSESRYQLSELKNSEWDKKARRMSFMFHLNNLSAHGNSQTSSGESLVGSTIRLVGFEMNSYLNDHWFLFAKFDGAYDGIPAGYMDIFLGAGYHFGFNKNRTNILAKFGMGAGGGGGVETKGGMLMYPDISLEQHISNNVFLTINKGFLMSPDAFFESSTLGFGLKYYTHINGIQNLKEESKNTFKGFEVVVKQDLYNNAKRMRNPTEDLYQIAVQFNYYLSKNIYLAGQTAFANFGNAGAYAEGIVGMGAQTNPFLKNKISLFVQGLMGGAGGGAISTGQGFIVKPSTGINYHLNSGLSIRGALGYIKARGGSLSSLTMNLGISYRFALLTSR